MKLKLEKGFWRATYQKSSAVILGLSLLLLWLLFLLLCWIRHVVRRHHSVGQWGCLLSCGLFFGGRNVNPEGLVSSNKLSRKPFSSSPRGLPLPPCVKLGSGCAAQLSLSTQAPRASTPRDTWLRIAEVLGATTFLGQWQRKTEASCWREGVLSWADRLSRRAEGDMGQLYGATLLPFGAICVVFLWESGASSIRTTLAVDTSRWVPTSGYSNIYISVVFVNEL